MGRNIPVYTKTGDQGTTALGSGERVSKDAPRIEAFGAVDELNSLVGVVLASRPAPELQAPLQAIQNELFHLGSDLCVPEAAKEKMSVPTIEARHVDALEKLMDELMESLPPLRNFVLPGGAAAAAALHVARAVCRRAERRVLALARVEPVGDQVIPYLNRLSDTLFVMARFQNASESRQDVLWNSRA